MTAFLDRPIQGDWPHLSVDATYVKARSPGRIVPMAVIVAVAVNSDGRREVLGMDIGPSETETFWTAFLRKLARRGLRGVKLVIARARLWLDEIMMGRVADTLALAEREGTSERAARQMLSLALLASDIVEAAASSTLPRGFGLSRLTDLPPGWDAQRRMLGIAG